MDFELWFDADGRLMDNPKVARGTRIIVCGGRYYANKDRVFAVLDELSVRYSVFFSTENWLPMDIEIVTGGCPTGADDLAAAWAMVNHSGYREFKADWKRYGNAAGPIRNQQMADYGADLCVHFPGGSDMVQRAKAAGITTIDGAIFAV